MQRRIAVLNRCTVADDAELQQITAALQKQVSDDFAAAWGVDAELTFVGKDQQHGWQGKWNLVVLDTSDEANALGYHDLTPEGLPLGKAFAKTDKMVHAHLSVTMSHELLEMLGDPGINLLAPDARGRIYAYENCDAVEADELGYQIAGVLVSDFVHPEWFISGLAHVKGMRFDHGGHVSKPFELARGGYISYTDVWPPNWQQIQGEGEPADDPLQRPRARLTPRAEKNGPAQLEEERGLKLFPQIPPQSCARDTNFLPVCKSERPTIIDTPSGGGHGCHG